MDKRTHDAPQMEVPKVFVQTIRPGLVIKSEHFQNLIYKDFMEQDPLCGFFVNPMKWRKEWDNTRFVLPESPGKIKKKSDIGKNVYIDLRQQIDPSKEFVVIYTERNVNFPKEYINEDDRVGHYPLHVVAKELDPEGNYDPFGIEITFNMESQFAKNVVEEVEDCGFINITYKRVF